MLSLPLLGIGGGSIPPAYVDTTASANGTPPRHIWPQWHAESVEQATLERARDGDEQAFRELTEPFRRELLAHCYRMLGSLVDAEDMMQETLLAAWRGLARFEGRSSLRSWLYRIATNTCLNTMRTATRRIPSEPTPPFQPPDSLLDEIADPTLGPEARYTQTEAIELAFVKSLQRMPPRQAAAVLLRDVIGFGTDEVAAMLQTSQTAVKGALQRGRAALENSRSDGRLPAPRSAEERDLARRFADAYVAADLDGILTVLTDDAWLSMPPAPHQYHGVDAIRSFLQASFEFRGERKAYLLPGRANSQPAFASYMTDRDESTASPAGLLVLTPTDERIAAITRFHLDNLYPPLGFPAQLRTGVGQSASRLKKT
jgi:RNA polymerase sigma-70 factor (TIGR02960 family)